MTWLQAFVDKDLLNPSTILGESHPQIQQIESCPVTQLDNYSLTLTLQAWCAHAGEAKLVEFDIYEQAARRFAAEGISSISASSIRVLDKTM
jgi:hypothetical protein